MSVKSFTVYEEYNNLIKLLKDENKESKLVYAIWKYMFEDKILDLDEDQTAIFNNLKRPLDKTKNKSKSKLNKIKTKSKINQNEIKNKSKINQNEIKNKSKINQKEIKTKTHQDVDVSNYYFNNNYDVNVNVYVYIENNLNITIGGTNYERIEEYLKIYSDEILCYAVDKTVASGHRTLNYFFGILENWKQDNLKTLEEIKERDKKPKKETIDEKFERLKKEGRI